MGDGGKNGGEAKTNKQAKPNHLMMSILLPDVVV